MTARADQRIGERPRIRFPFVHKHGTEEEHQSRAQRWFERAIEAWEADGRLTEADAATLREKIEEPQFVAVLPHFGVHLTIGAVLRFPVGSIVRFSYVLLNLLLASVRLLARRIDRRSWRQAFGIHSPLVLLIAGMPGIGTFAYLASRPMRTNPLLLRVGIDAALLKFPWNLYERSGLRWIVARPSAAVVQSLQEQSRSLRLTIPAPAIVLVFGVIAVGLFVADIAAQAITELRIVDPDTIGWKQLSRMLDLGAEASFGTWFQVISLVLLSMVLTTIAIARLRGHRPFAWHWFGLALLMLGFSIDEQVAIHEAIGGTEQLRDSLGISGASSYGWIVAGGLSILVVGLAYRRFLMALPQATRRLFVLAGLLYAGGEVGLEVVSYWYANVAGDESDIIYQTITSFEEFAGMAGIIIAIAAALHFAQLHVGDIGITLHDGIARTAAGGDAHCSGERKVAELQEPSGL